MTAVTATIIITMITGMSMVTTMTTITMTMVMLAVVGTTMSTGITASTATTERRAGYGREYGAGKRAPFSENGMRRQDLQHRIRFRIRCFERSACRSSVYQRCQACL